MNQIKLQAVPQEWLGASLLGPFSQRYLEHLERVRYPPSTARVLSVLRCPFRPLGLDRTACLGVHRRSRRARFIRVHLAV